MSSGNPPPQKYSGRTPRNFTEEQIYFVLDKASKHSNKDITALFNQRFAGVRTLELNQVKYIRTTYGRDPGWG
jgi:hypothetical protein